MRNKVFGTIGILWGGGVLVSLFFREAPFGRGVGPYAIGASVGVLFAVLMLIAGIYYVRK